MKTIYKILITLAVVGAVAFSFLYFKNFYGKKLPDLVQIKEKILTPGPLSGPRRPTRAEKLETQEIIKWTNFYRNQVNLSPLSENALLENAAQSKVLDMFFKQYFAHISPTGEGASDLVKAERYQFKTVGENLALGDFKDEKELVDAWMKSPGHRENILNTAFKEIGVAAKLGQYQGRITWLAVQIFAAKAPQCSPPPVSLKQQIEQKQALYEQISQFYQDAFALTEQGNAKIKQGNEIYRETGDQSLAEPYWREGEQFQNEGQVKINQAKTLETKIFDLKSLIYQYNKQVNLYNQCIGD